MTRPMRVGIIGARGQLGSALCEAFADHDVEAWNHADLDVTDRETLRAAFQARRPAVVINTAAFHRVDDCERDPDRSYLVNAVGARNVAAAAAAVDCAVVYISTDFVFGNDPGRREPWTEFDHPHPVNVYGRSKLWGEELTRACNPRHFIVRVSGLFGPGGSREKGGNFVDKILAQAAEKPELRVVGDLWFSPTYTRDAASTIAALAATDAYGVYHVVNEGVTTWRDLAAEALRLAGSGAAVAPITSDSLNLPARRPPYSALAPYHLRLSGFTPPRPWRAALADYLAVIGRLPAAATGGR